MTFRLRALLTGALLLAGCGPKDEHIPRVMGSSGIYHVMLGADGPVEIRKQTWTTYSRVSFGTEVNPDDLLRVGGGGRVKLVCSDLTVVNIGAGPPDTAPCPEQGELKTHLHETLLRGASLNCPMLTYPRKGQLLDQRPRIQWTAISDTRNYVVDVDAGAVHWKRDSRLGDDAKEGVFTYPADAPALPLGATVLVSIIGGSHNSNDCAPQTPKLKVLSKEDQASVRAAEQRLKGISLSNTEMDFLRANLWLSHRLYSEAITLLDHLVEDPAAPCAAFRLLGQAYEDADLADKAKDAYQKALARAAGSQDLEAQASLNADLAQITTDKVERARYVTEACALFKRLGDNQRAAEIAAK